jgi:hypothetical protein
MPNWKTSCLIGTWGEGSGVVLICVWLTQGGSCGGTWEAAMRHRFNEVLPLFYELGL